MFNITKSVGITSIILAAFPILLVGQEVPSVALEQEKPPESFVQFINATSIPLLTLEIKGGRKYTGLKPGARISGGIFPKVSWAITALPENASSGKTEVSDTFTLNSQKAMTVILTGDFQIIQKEGQKPELRAKIFKISNELESGQSSNRIVFCNGIPDAPLVIKVGEAEMKAVEALQLVTADSLPSAITSFVKAGDRTFEIPIEFLPPFKSIAVAFFKSPSGIDYTVMPMPSVEDYRQ
jgi:hypothetical protein